MIPPTLNHDGDNDYTLNDDETVWISVDNLSVYIRRSAENPELLIIEASLKGDEFNPIRSMGIYQTGEVA